MPLSPIELDYKAIYLACVDHTFSSISWVDRSLDYDTYSNPFSHVFSTNESIMEIMIPYNASWDDHHHHSSLPDSIEDSLSDVYLPNFVQSLKTFVSIHEVNFKNNHSNIKEMIPLDISVKLGIVKNLHICASYSPSKIEIYKAPFQEFRDVFA